jgi:hypothetical protein
MLKIKDNVNLEDLEKFGFKYSTNHIYFGKVMLVIIIIITLTLLQQR